MAKLISLAELRNLGATTFADIRRDEQLCRDRRAIEVRERRRIWRSNLNAIVRAA